MRARILFLACLIVTAGALGAAPPMPLRPPLDMPMLPHDVVNGCFELKPGSTELTAKGARGLGMLSQLVASKPKGVVAETVSINRPWPIAGSAESMFLSDDGYVGSSATVALDGSRTESRVYNASKSKILVATVLPELPLVNAINLAEVRGTEHPRCDIEVVVLVVLHDFPGPFYAYDCDADGCRELRRL